MIRIKDLSKSFGKKIVLDKLNLNFAPGEKIALVGSNGAGKTTLIRCLLGEYIYSGILEFKSKDIRSNRAKALKDVGFVPQLPPPLRMSVSQLLEFAAKISESSQQKMHKIATELGLNLDKIGAQTFTSLSGGQKQKVLICIVLGRDCKLLIMDEPAANLDPQARSVFFDLLEKKSQDTTMIISSHRLDEVASLVNRVIELDMGKVVIDDFVSDKVDFTTVLNCELEFKSNTENFANNLHNWDLSASADGLNWHGEILGADRFKFISMVSRYASSLAKINLEEKSET